MSAQPTPTDVTITQLAAILKDHTIASARMDTLARDGNATVRYINVKQFQI